MSCTQSKSVLSTLSENTIFFTTGKDTFGIDLVVKPIFYTPNSHSKQHTLLVNQNEKKEKEYIYLRILRNTLVLLYYSLQISLHQFIKAIMATPIVYVVFENYVVKLVLGAFGEIRKEFQNFSPIS